MARRGGKRPDESGRIDDLAIAAAAEAKERLAANVVRWIKAVAWIMGLSVAGYELINAPLDRLTADLDNSGLMKAGLVIYFFGWLWGATNDTEIQRVGYCIDPKEGKIGVKEALGILVFVPVFVALFVLHERPILFQAFLLTFILVNFWTWRLIFDRTRPMIEASYASFVADGREERANCSLAKLLTVVQYMNGPWQRLRFVTLIALAALQLAVAILLSKGILQAPAARLRIGGVSGSVLVAYLPGCLFLLYVIVSEIWMKIYRVKVFADLSTIDGLEARFTLSKRRDRDLPKPHMAGAFDFSACENRSYVGHGPVKWLLDLL